jgi:hypothetical protein
MLTRFGEVSALEMDENALAIASRQTTVTTSGLAIARMKSVPLLLCFIYRSFPRHGHFWRCTVLLAALLVRHWLRCLYRPASDISAT